MDIKQLKYFVTIVEANSFSVAARQLYLSQPTLSKAMNLLSKELGLELFYVANKQIHCTEHGKFLYKKAKALINEYDVLNKSLHNMATLQTGSIRIGIPPIIDTCVFPQLIADFVQQFPEIKLNISQHGAQSIQHQVDNEDIDVGFTILPVLSDSFNVVPIIEDKNVLIVWEDHYLIDTSMIELSHLQNENFILMNDEYVLTSNIIAGCREAGFEPRILFKVSHWDFAIQLVKLKMGITILPRQILQRYQESGIVQIELRHSLSNWRVVMITKKKAYFSLATKTFVEYIARTSALVNKN